VATLSDVAREAGVSSATASRALNNRASVNPALAVRVRAAAERLDYRPNLLARSLRRRRSDVCALIVSDVANPFFTALTRGVEDVAQRAGFSVLLCNSDEDPVKEARYLGVAETQQVAGVIMSPNLFGSDVSRLHAAGIPVVAVDRSLREPVDSVLVHSREGARGATHHLIEQGWLRPACITGPASADTSQERLRGYRDALHAQFGSGRAERVRHVDYRAEGGRAAVAELLDEPDPPDAFFVANSTMALGALEELARRSMRPGRDIGLVAFDDPPWASLLDPPMSVVVQPAYEVGVQAAELLLQRIAGAGPAQPRVVRLATRLIVRASSLHPAAQVLGAAV
jgi:LacI family transcriptional regulator